RLCSGGIPAESSSRIHAQKVLAAVTVNGVGDEWDCVDRLDLSAGQRVVGLTARRGVAQIAVQWDEQHLYFLAKMTTASPTPMASRLLNFQNDSLSIFLARPTPGPTYTGDDHQIVIDALGQVADYMVSARTSLAGIE